MSVGPVATSQHPGPGATIAIVEDQQAITELLTAVLREAGFHAVQIRTLRDVVAEVQAARADVVILDVMMPELSGWDVLDLLRADDATRELPVIVTSAVYDRPGLHALPQGGPIRFHPKPFDIAALVDLVRELTAG
ncbi:MAG: response regulator [Thermomicrobiales bacterium]